MRIRTVNPHRVMLFFVISLVFSQGCGLIQPEIPEPLREVASDSVARNLDGTQNAHQTETAQAMDGPADPVDPPAVVGTIQPTDVSKVMFAEADCPTEGFSGLEANYGAGGLDCRYQWMGPHSPVNLELTIMQIPDPEKYQQIVQTDLQNTKTSLSTIQATIAAGSPYKNDSLDIIKDGDEEIIYVRTYDLTTIVDGNEITELCADGWGTMAVNGKFEVTLQMPGICGLYTAAGDYSRLMTTMRDAALTAIENAEANNPR